MRNREGREIEIEIERESERRGREGGDGEINNNKSVLNW